MTKELFIDGYCKSCKATVLSCTKGKNGYEVILDQTCFYPEGGGQPGDTGILGSSQVIDTQRVDGKIIHYTEEKLEEGSVVQGSIDWDRRFTFMQFHTAEHILSGLIHSKYGFDNVGFHMSDIVTMDTGGLLSWEQLMEIETQANAIIQQGIELQTLYPSHKEETDIFYRSKKEIDQDLRLVIIPGVDSCACCGIHVKNTVEIGLIKILSVTKHKNGIRVEMMAGQKAREDYQYKYNQNKEISVLLKASPNETKNALDRILDQMNQKDKELSQIYHAYYKQRFNHQTIQIYIEEDFSLFRIKQFSDWCMKQEETEICAILSQGRFIIQSQSFDLRSIKDSLLEAWKGKGGGSKNILQGSYEIEESEARQVLESLLTLS